MLKEMQCDDVVETSGQEKADAEEFRRRILAWSNPVEFVNNMYGSHPDDGGTEYFKTIFSK